MNFSLIFVTILVYFSYNLTILVQCCLDETSVDCITKLHILSHNETSVRVRLTRVDDVLGKNLLYQCLYSKVFFDDFFYTQKIRVHSAFVSIYLQPGYNITYDGQKDDHKDSTTYERLDSADDNQSLIRFNLSPSEVHQGIDTILIFNLIRN